MPCRALLVVCVVLRILTPAPTSAEPPRQFRVWAASCSHVPADIRRGRESLARAIRQSEGLEPNAPAFDWDIMIDAGDLSAHQEPPGDRDGKELIRQYRAMTKHRREQVYNVPGNHDAPYYDHGPGSWIRKWGDPLGEHTEFSGVDPKRRPFPVEGTWERYRFVAGNVLFLMLADRNDAPTPVGRGHSREGKSGGYPPGAVTRETFNWWKQQVLDNQDKIIVTMHHHALRDTTVASGRGEGTPRYHGSTGGTEGSSYLYYIIEKDDPDDFRFTADAHVFEDFLDEFHQENGSGAIDFWIAGHTHVKSPDDDWGEKTISEMRWGVGFLQIAALTRHHGGATPLSRVLTFTDGTEDLTAEVYLHEASYKDNPVGWYAPATRQFTLRHKFAAPEPIKVLPPFPASAKIFSEPYIAPKPSRGPDPALIKAEPSADLTSHWDASKGGVIHFERALQTDTDDRIGNKPEVVTDAPSDGEFATKFVGNQRVRIGPIDMEDWKGLTVSARINTTQNQSGMRIVSKDRIGQPGCFMLWHSQAGAWTMQAWDDLAMKWRVATWRSDSLSDGKWHSLTGVADSTRQKVSLYVDGELKTEAKWMSATLDDSDRTDLVIGAGSGEERFGHTFRGMIQNVHVYPHALDAERIKAIHATTGSPVR